MLRAVAFRLCADHSTLHLALCALLYFDTEHCLSLVSIAVTQAVVRDISSTADLVCGLGLIIFAGVFSGVPDLPTDPSRAAGMLFLDDVLVRCPAKFCRALQKTQLPVPRAGFSPARDLSTPRDHHPVKHYKR